jgi:hypothetical protein
LGGLDQHIFGNMANKKEISDAIYGVVFLIFFGVGLVECLSILFCIISLSFRRFGKVFGRENHLHNMFEISACFTSSYLGNTDFYAILASDSQWLAMARNGSQWLAMARNGSHRQSIRS